MNGQYFTIIDGEVRPVAIKRITVNPIVFHLANGLSVPRTQLFTKNEIDFFIETGQIPRT